MRSFERRIQDQIKEEISKYNNKQISYNKKLQEIYEKSLRDQAEAYVRKKIENDQRIMHEAALEAEKSIQAFDDEMSRVDAIVKKRERDMMFTVITKYHSRIRSGYDRITVLLQSTESENLQNIQKHNEIIQSIIVNFDEITNKVNSGDFGIEEMETAEMLVRRLGELEESIDRDIEIYANEKLAKELEAQKQAAELPQLPAEVYEPTPPPSMDSTIPVQEVYESVVPIQEVAKPLPVPNTNQFVHPDRLNFYNRIMEFYTHKVESVKPLQVRLIIFRELDGNYNNVKQN